MRVELGDRVKDVITGLEGIVVGATEWLYGCRRLSIQPEKAKDGKPVDMFVIDEPQAIIVKSGVVVPPKSERTKLPPHGPRNDPTPQRIPSRR